MALAGFIFLSGLFLLWISTFKIPDLSTITERKVRQSTKIYDRTGEVLLYDVYENVKRKIIPYDQISRNIKNATVAIEDDEFYEHRGVKPRAFLRAVFANIRRGGFSQGGSTITQQVVKNSILTADKKPSRKIKEWVLAVKLEKILNKEEILALYLNEVPYGGSMYGVEEASQTFFGKSAADVTLAEAAYLASIPNAPTYYSPYGNHKDKLEDRKNLVLARMFENAFINEEAYEGAKKEQVVWKPQANTGIKAPHFVMFIRQYLVNTYGEKAVLEKGLKVITTLDYKLQEKAEEIAKKFALENEKNFNAENASIVAVDPKNGQILAMVGSRDYFDKEIDGNFNVAIANRQPGSAFKPFVYAAAFNKGYTPDTVVFDLETEFSTTCNPDGTPIVPGDEKSCYRPQNYDSVYRGPVTFRNALAQSINIPAIKALYLAGLKDSLRLAKDLGISSLTNTDQYGLTLVLGGGEVSLLEMTSAYGVFANKGERNPHTGILKIEGGDGSLLEEFTPEPRQVLSEQIASQISDILSDEDARAPAFGRRSFLYFDRDVAAKTGTTNDYKDAWIIGYSPQIAVGAWAGNNDHTSMEKKVAGFIVAPLWNAFMREALKNYPNQDFEEPAEEDTAILKPVLKGVWQGGRSYFVNKQTGELVTELTPQEQKEERVVKEVHSILYWVDKNNPRGPIPQNPDSDPQFKLWEYPVRDWVQKTGIIEEDGSVIPTVFDSVHKPEFIPKISFVSPAKDLVYSKNNRVVISIASTSHYPISKVDYYLNNHLIGSTQKTPFTFVFTPNTVQNLKEVNELKAVAYDTYSNKGEVVMLFKSGM